MVTARAQKGKGRQKKQNNAPTEYIQVGEEPKPDSSTKFTGIVKYRITTDDPSDLDSMFVVFGDNQIAITMFYPGVREGEVIKEHSIAIQRQQLHQAGYQEPHLSQTKALGAERRHTDRTDEYAKDSAGAQTCMH